jgi:beta-glucanase (GH16 family)
MSQATTAALALCLSVSLCSGGTTSPKAKAQPSPTAGLPAGWKMVWHDEFDGSALDSTKWKPPGYKIREGQQLNTPGTATVSGGMLQLSAFIKDQQLHGPIIETKNTQRFRYGYFESRLKMQSQEGHHSAFWLQTPVPQGTFNDLAQAGTEIDIIEWFGPGRRQGWAGMNIYYPKDGQLVRSPSKQNFALMGGPDPARPQRPLADLGAAFHTYSLQWSPEELVFRFDGLVVMRDNQAVSKADEYLVLSLLSSSWERPRLNLKRLPDSMLVDYVRVYQPDSPDYRSVSCLKGKG